MVNDAIFQAADQNTRGLPVIPAELAAVVSSLSRHTPMARLPEALQAVYERYIQGAVQA